MRKKCGLALSGGGIKAFSQVGVVRFLKENGFKFDGFSGTSMGSIIATFLAHDIPINQVENSILKIEKIIIDEKLLDASNAQVFPLITRSITGLIDPSRFVRIIEDSFLKLRKCNNLLNDAHCFFDFFFLLGIEIYKD